jgi:hypothetical protein
MLLRLAKRKHKPVAFTCVRDDGSCTWQPSSDYFAYHDLIHYAVEKTLGYKEAFLGLVAQGKNLDAFGTKNGVKDVYTLEEAWAESLVGTLQWPSLNGAPPLSDEETLALFAKTCADNNVPMPPLTAAQIGQIRAYARTLHHQWAELPDDETLELVF